MPVVLYQGKSLQDWLDSLRRELLASTTPPTIDMAVTAVGLTDPFVRKLVARAFRQTLKEGGTNWDLTRDSRWLKTIEKWAPPNITAAPKSRDTTAVFSPTTQATDAMLAKAQELNGQLPAEAQAAIANLGSIMARSAGKTFDEARLDETVGEINNLVASHAAVGRELEIHRQYQKEMFSNNESLRRAADVFRRLVEDQLEPGSGKNVR
jgi:hypothetical protein